MNVLNNKLNSFYCMFYFSFVVEKSGFFSWCATFYRIAAMKERRIQSIASFFVFCSLVLLSATAVA